MARVLVKKGESRLLDFETSNCTDDEFESFVKEMEEINETHQVTNMNIEFKEGVTFDEINKMFVENDGEPYIKSTIYEVKDK